MFFTSLFESTLKVKNFESNNEEKTGQQKTNPEPSISEKKSEE